jgi:hypothetical protein
MTKSCQALISDFYKKAYKHLKRCLDMLYFGKEEELYEKRR